MQIKDIFTKDIFRPINGVVKADQLDESSVWQELDEYVITQELDQYFRKFISAYLAALDMKTDPTITSRMGVWISGFFGSGKSHFLKILSYLLANRSVTKPGTSESRRAIDFFADKIKDPMLLADFKRMASLETDALLFNIDSRADASDGRTAILSVFWKVFNESQGLCGEYLHVSEIERYLVRKGKYDDFKTRFQQIHGSSWEEERDAYALNQDEIIQALSAALGKSEQAAREWFEKSEQDFNLTVENFAKRVREYLDTRSKDHRLVFLVDEVGQFIGEDTHLMLSLQTIVEDLGRICNGQVWVIVTSQEDIDKVIGDVKASKANDFSKIQGRFFSRLSLSSTNTDEVIQTRLLEKTEDAKPPLRDLYQVKGEILKNQLSFTYDSSTLKNYDNADDFICNYPFAPYHFQLVQKIFESIRKAGATGLHLSRGERSLLDAFQSAAISISSKGLDALVPLYEFYPCIESFLDTSVKRSIAQAQENRGLDNPFDVQILQALFLVRYADIVKPNIDNLVTLCISEVDADRIDLKKRIDASLQRLEKETLINRNGDLYFFLTNEEREVSQEIKSVQIMPADETQLMGDIIFDDILKNKTKHRYTPYSRDYALNRICDQKVWGKIMEDELGIEIISPLHDEYSLFSPAKCNLYTANQGNMVVKLDESRALIDELRLYLKTSKYINNKSDAAASENLKLILRDKADENRKRKERLVEGIDQLIVRAEFYALGKRLDIKGQTSSKAMDEGLDYLVENIFTKFSYLTFVYPDPITEITQILKSDDVAQQQFSLALNNEAEPADIKEVKNHIKLKTVANHLIMLDELVKYFSKRPYGWGDLQIVILVAKIYMAGEINLVVEGAKLKPKDAVIPLTRTNHWKTVKIIKKEILPKEKMEKARTLGKELFGSIAPEGQEQLCKFIREGLSGWIQSINKIKPLADTGSYPGKKEIDDCISLFADIHQIQDPYELIKKFNAKKEDLTDAADDLQVLLDFYNNQRQTWEKLRQAIAAYLSNKSALEKYPDAAAALKRMIEIVNAPAPWSMIKEVNALIARVEPVNSKLVAENRDAALKVMDEKINQLAAPLNKYNAPADFRNQVLYPLQHQKKKVGEETSIPQISYDLEESQALFEQAWDKIEDEFKPPGPKPNPVKTIKAATLSPKFYIETEAEADEFITRIKKEILDAVKGSYRVKIS